MLIRHPARGAGGDSFHRALAGAIARFPNPRRLPICAESSIADVEVKQTRGLAIEDLLARTVGLKPGRFTFHRLIEGKRVIVTAPEAPIGSELCRQIVDLSAQFRDAQAGSTRSVPSALSR